MKDLSAPFASEVVRTGLVKAAIPAIHSAVRLFDLLLVDGLVVLTRPRLGALFSCRDEKSQLTEGARVDTTNLALVPAALDVAGTSSERTRAYVTSIR